MFFNNLNLHGKKEMKVKKLIFVTNDAQVDVYLNALLKGGSPDCADSLFIALNPIAHACLMRHKLPCRNTFDYFKTDSQIKILDKSKALTDWLRQNIEIIESMFGFSYACRETSILLIRSRLNYFLKFIEIINNVMDVHSPDIVLASASDEKYASKKFLTFDANCLGLIVKLVAKNRSLRFEEIIQDRNNHSVSMFSGFIGLVKLIFKWLEFSLWEKKKLLVNFLYKGRIILLTTKRYNMDRLAEKLSRAGKKNRIVFLSNPVISDVYLNYFIIALLNHRLPPIIKKQRELFGRLGERIDRNNALFTYRQIDLRYLFNQASRKNITEYIINLFIWLVRLSAFIHSIKPQAILSCGHRADDVALSEIAGSGDIPIMLISHGSHVKPKNNYETFEWGEQGMMLLRAPFSLLASPTPLTEGYISSFSIKSRLVKSGPLIWGMPVDLSKSKRVYEKMFNRNYEHKKDKIILHAGTPKVCARFYIYETGDEYIQSLLDLAIAVENMPNVILVIKFRSSSEITLDAIRTIIPFSDKVILSVDERFIDILGLTDLLLSFSSTTIEEALQNRIPVLQYGGGGRYQHVPAQEVKLANDIAPAAVYHASSYNVLEYAIPKILDLNIKDNNDKDLFSQYIYPEQSRESVVDLITAKHSS